MKKSTAAQNVDLSIALPSSEMEKQSALKLRTTPEQETSDQQQQPAIPATDQQPAPPEKSQQQPATPATDQQPAPTDTSTTPALKLLKKKAQQYSTKTAAAATRKEIEPEEKKPLGRPTGTTKAAIDARQLEENAVFTKENIKFYVDTLNGQLKKIEMDCSPAELENFIDPLHRYINKKFSNAKFLTTDEGQLTFLAIATFLPKLPKGIKNVRTKFNRRNFWNEQTRENVPIKPESS